MVRQIFLHIAGLVFQKTHKVCIFLVQKAQCRSHYAFVGGFHWMKTHNFWIHLEQYINPSQPLSHVSHFWGGQDAKKHAKNHLSALFLEASLRFLSTLCINNIWRARNHLFECLMSLSCIKNPGLSIASFRLGFGPR